MTEALDEIDVRLLVELQTDADRTNLELSRVVGLSPAATLHRVRRLKESGVIQSIAARLDPAAAGLTLTVFVTATLERNDPITTKRFVEAIRSTEQVLWAEWVAGEVDVMMRMVARDVAELQNTLNKLSSKGGHRLTTMLSLEEIKAHSPLPLAGSRAQRNR